VVEDRVEAAAGDRVRAAWADPKPPVLEANASAPVADTGCRIRLEDHVMRSNVPSAVQRWRVNKRLTRDLIMCNCA
jgi:hypothetical protein